MDIYDHTNVKGRPSILIEVYCRECVPFLTVIHLWDEKVDYMLASRHESVKFGMGEGGMNNGISDDKAESTSKS